VCLEPAINCTLPFFWNAGKSDPYLQISRQSQHGTWTVVHKTEVIKKTLNPSWRPFTVTVQTLCNGDWDRPLKFESFDWDNDGSHDFIGAFETSLRELTTNGSWSGEVSVSRVAVGRYSFLGIFLLFTCA